MTKDCLVTKVIAQNVVLEYAPQTRFPKIEKENFLEKLEWLVQGFELKERIVFGTEINVHVRDKCF